MLFSVCRKCLSRKLSSLSGGHSHKSYTLSHSKLRSSASSHLFRGIVTLRALRVSNLPSIAFRYDWFMEIFGYGSVFNTNARGVQGLQGWYSVQRLSRGKDKMILLRYAWIMRFTWSVDNNKLNLNLSGVNGKIPYCRFEMFELWKL